MKPGLFSCNINDGTGEADVLTAAGLNANDAVSVAIASVSTLITTPWKVTSLPTGENKLSRGPGGDPTTGSIAYRLTAARPGGCSRPGPPEVLY